MKIVCRTVITQIGTDKRIKPESALWAIFNDGSETVLLNNNIIIYPGETFGIDVTNLYGIKNIEEIRNDTEFDLRFIITGTPPHSCQLIETYFEKKIK